MKTDSIISKIFPECKLKEKMRKLYYAYSCNQYYALNNIIREIDQQDKMIVINLTSGFMFYNYYFPSKPGYCLKYGNPKKLTNLTKYKGYEGFYNVLIDP